MKDCARSVPGKAVVETPILQSSEENRIYHRSVTKAANCTARWKGKRITSRDEISKRARRRSNNVERWPITRLDEDRELTSLFFAGTKESITAVEN